MRFNAKYRDLFVGLMTVGSVVAMANAQTCDSLLGGSNCGAARQGAAPPPPNQQKTGGDWDFGGRSSSRGLGIDLTSTASSDTGFFGAITFSGGRTTCSGPFRSRQC